MRPDPRLDEFIDCALRAGIADLAYHEFHTDEYPMFKNPITQAAWLCWEGRASLEQWDREDERNAPLLKDLGKNISSWVDHRWRRFRRRVSFNRKYRELLKQAKRTPGQPAVGITAWGDQVCLTLINDDGRTRLRTETMVEGGEAFINETRTDAATGFGIAAVDAPRAD